QHLGGAGYTRRASNAKAGAVRAEGQMTVRTHIRTREVLAIKVNSKRQADKSIAVVGMVTDVVHSRHERSCARSEVVCANGALGSGNGLVSAGGSSGEAIGTWGSRRAFANQGRRRTGPRVRRCEFRTRNRPGGASLGCVSLRQREWNHAYGQQ